jgi:hypothetical protein
MHIPKFMIVATSRESDPNTNESVTRECVLGQFGALELKDYQKAVATLRKLPEYAGVAFILRPVNPYPEQDPAD